MDHKWKQLILVVNFLFGLRVKERHLYRILTSPHLQCRNSNNMTVQTMRIGFVKNYPGDFEKNSLFLGNS
jgi:hypothetical protein